MASNPPPWQGQVLLGTVGAFDWSGGALLYDTHRCNGSFLNQTAVDTKSAQYGYLGEGGARRLPGWGRGLSRDAGCGRIPSWRGPWLFMWTEGWMLRLVPTCQVLGRCLGRRGLSISNSGE